MLDWGCQSVPLQSGSPCSVHYSAFLLLRPFASCLRSLDPVWSCAGSLLVLSWLETAHIMYNRLHLRLVSLPVPPSSGTQKTSNCWIHYYVKLEFDHSAQAVELTISCWDLGCYYFLGRTCRYTTGYCCYSNWCRGVGWYLYSLFCCFRLPLAQPTTLC